MFIIIFFNNYSTRNKYLFQSIHFFTRNTSENTAHLMLFDFFIKLPGFGTMIRGNEHQTVMSFNNKTNLFDYQMVDRYKMLRIDFLNQ